MKDIGDGGEENGGVLLLLALVCFYPMLFLGPAIQNNGGSL